MPGRWSSDAGSLERAEAAAVAAALAAIDRGRTRSSSRPAAPTIRRCRRSARRCGRAGSPARTPNVRIGAALGRVLDAVIRRAGLRRAVISGGDTSGHASRQLGIHALTALAPTIPGAAIFRAHGDGAHDGLELALKGGQMGSPDYFGWVRDGGGPRD